MTDSQVSEIDKYINSRLTSRELNIYRKFQPFTSNIPRYPDIPKFNRLLFHYILELIRDGYTQHCKLFFFQK